MSESTGGRPPGEVAQAPIGPVPATPSPPPAVAVTARRAVLRGAGVGLFAAVGGTALGACSAGPNPPGGAGSSPSPVGGIPASDIPVRGGRVFEGARVVVTQPAQGTFKAFDATCPHQGCEVTEVADNVIVCPCHGSTFDAATGARLGGPAPRGLTPRSVAESDGTLSVD